MATNRRTFLKLAVGASAVAAGGFPFLCLGAKPRIVIVGGGIGGATAARYLRRADAGLDITLIEPKSAYHTCFMSNEVISGERELDSIRFGYDGLQHDNIKVVSQAATGVDPEARKVTLANGDVLSYDRCIVAPGVNLDFYAIPGYDAEAAEMIPHAWQAGPQTALLRDQLRAMPDGGTVVIAPPRHPFRCPPGPYERVCQIAHYLKHNKPKSKIIVLDPKDKFSKFGLFKQGWANHYGYGTDNSMIEWVSGKEGGEVSAVDAKQMSITAGAGTFKADVMNVIPPQGAGMIAVDADLVDASGWCPINHQTFESTRYPGVHVIGDASIAKPMPKSGYAANSQAKVCAAAIVASLRGEPAPAPSWVNTCYSIITPEDCVSVSAVYRLGTDGNIVAVKGAGGLTPEDASPAMRKRAVAYAHSWFRNITRDTFG